MKSDVQAAFVFTKQGEGSANIVEAELDLVTDICNNG